MSHRAVLFGTLASCPIVADVNVTVDVDHAFAADLDVFLRSSVTNPDGDLSYDSAPAAEGTWILGVDVDDTAPVFLRDNRPSSADSDFHARFLINADAFTVGTNGDRTKVFQARAGSNRRSLTLVLRQLGGVNKILAKSKLDDESFANSGFFDLSPGWHLLEVHLRTSPTDGSLELQVDGALYYASPVLVNSLSDVFDARLGVISVKPGATGTLYFDSYESRKDAGIGP